MTSPRESSSVVAIAAAAASGVLLTAAWLCRRHEKKSNAWLEIPPELVHCDFVQELKLALTLAKQAGDNMERYCDTVGTSLSEKLEINTKGQPEDFCTAIDLLNEELIAKGIRSRFPDHAIIGEESTGTGSIPLLDEKKTWILDPIDGTTNFTSGLPLTCVSIGFCEGKKPVMGVVYVPMTREVYVAVRGHGAYRNGERLSPNKNTSLKDAIVVFEFGYTRSTEGIAKMVGGLQRILNKGCRAVRGLGSGVLDLCLVARGSIDVVYAGVAGEGWKPWDHCAGMVICTEAGCRIESLFQAGKDNQEEFDIYSDSIICAVNQELLEECRNVVCKGL